MNQFSLMTVDAVVPKVLMNEGQKSKQPGHIVPLPKYKTLLGFSCLSIYAIYIIILYIYIQATI